MWSSALVNLAGQKQLAILVERLAKKDASLAQILMHLSLTHSHLPERLLRGREWAAFLAPAS